MARGETAAVTREVGEDQLRGGEEGGVVNVAIVGVGGVGEYHRASVVGLGRCVQDLNEMMCRAIASRAKSVRWIPRRSAHSVASANMASVVFSRIERFIRIRIGLAVFEETG